MNNILKNLFNLFSKSKSDPQYKGWKLTLQYCIDHSDTQEFVLVYDKTSNQEESDRNNRTLKSIVEKIYNQLNSSTDDNYINIENSLLIKKDQFVSVSISQIK